MTGNTEGKLAKGVFAKFKRDVKKYKGRNLRKGKRKIAPVFEQRRKFFSPKEEIQTQNPRGKFASKI